ncbi:hypothetical protein RirG_260910 [Rhizophagus irregularis DAOM 197198w]|uniref:Uncharacterized protein n=1 Tax=Rhizophagus irregularis (strain DAOM 197198w) TaxID=1432141 RepID=A0A015I3G6_RHIIW|nr:hypothetical protein RirG_260910 [Rhizophagus irregularis DAOM 197198w]
MVYVEERLYGEISLMYIRFVIQPEEDNGESSSRNQEIQQNQTNIFDTMMKRARHMQKKRRHLF